MFALIIIASISPNIGKSGGYLHIDQVSNFGIALVFFLYGLGLSFEKLKQGMSSWKVHILVQLTKFVVYPLIFFLFSKSLGNRIPNDLLLGFCYLCALPSTVSSSVAMTGIAKGNVPAVFCGSKKTLASGVPMAKIIFGAHPGLGLIMLPIILFHQM
jgi:sodium/bile acid cotransporter 7